MIFLFATVSTFKKINGISISDLFLILCQHLFYLLFSFLTTLLEIWWNFRSYPKLFFFVIYNHYKLEIGVEIREHLSVSVALGRL